MTQPARYRQESFSDFATLPDAYRGLLSTSAGTFDQTLIWYQTFARHLLRADEKLVLLGLCDEACGTPAALLPLRCARGSRGPLRVRSVTALTNYYSALFGPVLAADSDASAASEALALSLTNLAPSWNLLDLNPLAPEDAFFVACSRSLRAAGCLVRPYFRFGNWYLEVGGRSFAEYFADMPSRMRSTLARKSKKLRAGDAATLEVIQHPERVDAALDTYEAIYRRSWKQDEPHKEFIRDVAHQFAEQGWVRIGLVHIGGVPAAAQIWWVHAGTASIFKLAYDPAFMDLSVGSLLTMKLMEHAMDVDRVSVIDYLCGDDAYKRDWMSHRRERWGLRASPWLSLVGVAEAGRWIGSRVRDVVRKPSPTQPVATADEAIA